MHKAYLVGAESKEAVEFVIKDIKDILPAEEYSADVLDFLIFLDEVPGRHSIYYEFIKSKEQKPDFIIIAHIKTCDAICELNEVMDKVSKLEGVKYFETLSLGDKRKLKTQFRNRYGSEV